MAVTKITTCCYCGARAALVLRGKERHELSCSNCGAPLHMLKMLPMASARAAAPGATPARPEPKKRRDYRDDRRVQKSKKKRKTKSFGRKVLSGVWDVIEDIVDEVFD
jgi:hypothetical protein